MGLIRELKQRKVFKVAFLYAVTAWLLAQVAGLALPAFDAPAWVLRVFLFFLMLGFPVALIMAWALELTPEGIRRAEPGVGETRVWLAAGVIAIAAISWFEFGSQDSAVQAPEIADDEVIEGKAADVDVPVSIAVLPFLDLSPDKDQDYFALGMSEELLNVLAKTGTMPVASRTSAFGYKDSTLGADEIGRELGVTHVLEGSIRKAGKQLRITAQLIDVSSDRHLWSETYDRSLEDVFRLQDEIATAIVDALREPLGIDDPDDVVSVSASTENVDAYTLYLEGRELFVLRDVKPAIDSLERAIALDPEFEEALELLSAVYVVAPGWIRADRPYLELAEAAARRALAMNPQLSLARATLGNVAMGSDSLDLLAAEEHLQAALVIDPGNATAQSWLALLWTVAGYFDRAIEAFERCLEIEPGYTNCTRNLGTTHAFAGNHEQARELFENILSVTLIGMDNDVEFILSFLEVDNRATALLLGHLSLADAGIRFENWEQLFLTPRNQHTARRELFREQLLGVHENRHPGDWVTANYFLAAIGYPEDVRIGAYDYFWLLMQLPAYREATALHQAHIEQSGIIPLWQKYGPPPRCREVSGDRYECTAP